MQLADRMLRMDLLDHVCNMCMTICQHVNVLQSIKVGTYDDVFGPGSTPSWALPTDVMKYQDDQLVEEETGYVLDYRVRP